MDVSDENLLEDYREIAAREDLSRVVKFGMIHFQVLLFKKKVREKG